MVEVSEVNEGKVKVDDFKGIPTYFKILEYYLIITENIKRIKKT